MTKSEMTSSLTLLLDAGADPIHQTSQSLRHAISSGDSGLLRRLLRCPAGVVPGHVSSLVTDVFRLPSASIHNEMVSFIIGSGANVESLSRALCEELSKESIFIPLVQVLIKHADIRFGNAKAIVLATSSLYHAPLATAMTSPTVDIASVRNALGVLLRFSTIFSDEQMASSTSVHLNAVTAKNKENLAHTGLKLHVERFHSLHPDANWPMQAFQVLLYAGPDLTANNGEIVSVAAKASAVSLLRDDGFLSLLLVKHSSITSLMALMLDRQQTCQWTIKPRSLPCPKH